MENTTPKITPQYILDTVILRRWYIIIPLILSLSAGVYLAKKLPKKYSASAMILIQPQTVPNSYVRSLVDTDITARIRTLSQQILSRTNLEKIITKYNLYSGSVTQEIYMEDKVRALRKNINVAITRNRRNTDAFTITYKGKKPKRVADVVNTITNYFTNENLKARYAQASGTSDILEDELNTMRMRLEGTEGRMKKYREAYMGELPEQLETNLRIIDRLQNQLSNSQENLRNARNRLSLYESQIRTNVSMRRQPGTNITGNQQTQNRTSAQVKQELTELKVKYTDEHPDVIRLMEILRELEETESKLPRPTARDLALSPAERRQYEATKIEIKTVEQGIIELKENIEYYQSRVDATPKREQELISLRRDYQNIQNSYNSLLNRKLESEIAISLEKKQKGEQFRVLDPARVPKRPIEPDMRKLFLMILALGLGTGGGFIFLLEYFNSSFKKSDEIETFSDLPVLANIPRIYSKKDKMLRNINVTLSILTLSVAAGLFVVFINRTILV